MAMVPLEFHINNMIMTLAIKQVLKSEGCLFCNDRLNRKNTITVLKR